MKTNQSLTVENIKAHVEYIKKFHSETSMIALQDLLQWPVRDLYLNLRTRLMRITPDLDGVEIWPPKGSNGDPDIIKFADEKKANDKLLRFVVGFGNY